MTWCSERLDGEVPPTFCAQWQVRNDELYVTFEGQSGGWLALGFAPNPSMLGTPLPTHAPIAALALTLHSPNAMLAVRAGADVYQCALPAGGTGTLVARHVPDSVRNPQTYATQHVSHIGRARLQRGPRVSCANHIDA